MKEILKNIKPVNEKGNLNVIIEIQKGSKNKYELDKETGLIMLDRVMYTGQDYPFDYGFVPNTLCEDGDPLDVILYTTYPLMPGVLVEARPVGVIKMIDGGEADDKILAVPENDPRLKDMLSLETFPKHFVKEVQHFLETYKMIQNKIVKIENIEDINGAKKSIDDSIKMYSEKN
jgi:inorganic pyrophosphatase